MNLLGIKDLSCDEISNLLDMADVYLDKIQTKEIAEPILQNKVLINAFFENSTRTRISFEMAAMRLGGQVINFSAASSSIKKGETIIDTLQTLNMMQPDIFVVRAKQEDMPGLSSKHLSCPVINAGSGMSSHPTQALLDALVMRKHLKRLDGVKVAICGDIRHSRVAGSNIELLQKCGAIVHLIAPEEFLPKSTNINTKLYTDMNDGIAGVDVVMMLRVQKERMEDNIWFDEHAYFKHYGLTHDRLKQFAPKAIVMHPGPMNRGIEIASDVADNADYSVILQQVEAGVAVRMACLDYSRTS